MDNLAFSQKLGQQIRNRRNELGLTQAQLSERAGVSKRLVAGVEAGQATQISLGRLLSILVELDLEFSVGDVSTLKGRETLAPATTTEELADLFEERRRQLSESTAALTSPLEGQSPKARGKEPDDGI